MKEQIMKEQTIQTVDVYVSNLPKGAIIMFYGTNIPDGWAICNGENNTPNLIGKFPLGGDLSSKGNTGGAKTVNIKAKNLPKHLGYPTDCAGTGCSDKDDIINVKNDPNKDAIGDEPLDIMPPYTAVIFIMKTQ